MRPRRTAPPGKKSIDSDASTNLKMLFKAAVGNNGSTGIRTPGPRGRGLCRTSGPVHFGVPGRQYHNDGRRRSEEHTSELQSLMRISYAVFCLKNQKNQ